MILNQRDTSLIRVAMKLDPFKADQALIDEFIQVLIVGNKKHANDRATAEDHLQHALEHLKQDGPDTETGCGHKAHAAARLILGLITLTKGRTEYERRNEN